MRTTNSIAELLIKRKSIQTLMLVVFIFANLLILPDLAMASIARISSFKGEVIVQSGDTVSKVVAPGQQVNNGDIVLTKQGEAQVTFTDGGILRINPFTQIMIQERKEESGFLFFKRTDVARRITCYLGKLWFKSGLSGTKNYLQSPTAVAGLRGSDGDYGFNPATMQTFLNMYSGEAAVVGNVIRGFFENPGITVAAKAQVYQNLVQAYNKTEQAKASGNVIDQAQAKVDTLKIVKEAATILVQNNPDATVKQQAQLANAAADASIASATAQVAVEQIKEAKKDDASLKAAEAAAAAAAAANERAKAIADSAKPDLNQLNQAVNDAQKAANDTVKIQEQVAPTTVPATVAPTTAAATTTAATTTVPPTTAPFTTTIETTVPITTTSTPTSSTTIKPISNP